MVVMVPRSFPPLSHALLVSGAEREREREMHLSLKMALQA